MWKKLENYPNYEICEEGVVRNTASGELSHGTTTEAGYRTFTLRHKDGERSRIFRHRLLMETFVPVANMDQLYVNHLNGVKGDDRLENLEWVTRQANLEHAGRMRLTTRCKPCEVHEVDTGKILYFPSSQACARHYKMEPAVVRVRLNHEYGQLAIYEENRQYRWWLHDDRPWPSVKVKVRLSRRKIVQVRYLDTLKVEEFDQQTEAAAALGISIGQLSTRLNRQAPGKIYPGNIQIRYQTDDQWPTPVADGAKHAVIATDAEGNETWYGSVRECAVAHGLMSSALSMRLLKPSKNPRDGIRFRYAPTIRPVDE